MNTLYASEFAVQGKGKNANPDYLHVLEIYKLIIFGYIMYNYIEHVDCSDDRDSEYFFFFQGLPA